MFAATLFMPGTSFATDPYAVGASCTPNGITAGPNQSGQNVVCASGVWAIGSGLWNNSGTSYYYNGGNVGIGTASPNSNTALDLSGKSNAMLLPVGTTGQEPTGTAGMIRYNSTTKDVEFYNGSVWYSVKPSGPPPTGSGAFVISQGQFNGCLGPPVASITYSGTTATVTVTGNGGGILDLVTGQTVTITGGTPTTYNVTGASITVTGAKTFTYTMSGTPTGNDSTATATEICPDSGGLTLANKLCLQDLTTNTSWYGYAQANAAGLLNSTHVKAFLCDGSTCNNLDASTTYYFGNAYDTTSGGASFTTDSSGYGPNDTNNWQTATAFGLVDLAPLAQTYWTGRSYTSGTKWAGTLSNNICTGWTSVSGNGEVGGVQTSGGITAGIARWTGTTQNCSPTAGYNPALICLVNP